MKIEEVGTEQVANMLGVWARGELPPRRQPHVIFAPPDAVGWLADPKTGLVADDSVVFIRNRQAIIENPGRVGIWRGYSGEFEGSGDEIQIGKELWLQTVDYYSTRFLAIAGPTVVRFADREDATAFARDVSSVRNTGSIGSALLHGAVELGDHCLIGGKPCTADGNITRLYIDGEGLVRTAPRGLVLGKVGDSGEAISEAGREFAAAGIDVCAGSDISSALSEASLADRLMFLSVLDAVRTMVLRTKQPWKVSGIDGRVALGDEPGDSLAPRADFLLLWSGDTHVLFDHSHRRAFAISADMAEVLDVALHLSSDEDTEHRLAGRQVVRGDAAGALEAVRSALGGRGVAARHVQ